METSTAITVRTNVQVVQDAFTEFLKGNIPAIVDICADDVVWGSYKIPDVPYSGMLYGKEGVMEFFTTLAENVDFTSFEPKEFFSQGDDVFVLGHNLGVVKSTGLTFENNWCMHFRFREGKLKTYFDFLDSYNQAKAFRKI